jgi:hypothetical protein
MQIDYDYRRYLQSISPKTKWAVQIFCTSAESWLAASNPWNIVDSTVHNAVFAWNGITPIISFGLEKKGQIPRQFFYRASYRV